MSGWFYRQQRANNELLRDALFNLVPTWTAFGAASESWSADVAALICEYASELVREVPFDNCNSVRCLSTDKDGNCFALCVNNGKYFITSVPFYGQQHPRAVVLSPYRTTASGFVCMDGQIYFIGKHSGDSEYLLRLDFNHKAVGTYDRIPPKKKKKKNAEPLPQQTVIERVALINTFFRPLDMAIDYDSKTIHIFGNARGFPQLAKFCLNPDKNKGSCRDSDSKDSEGLPIIEPYKRLNFFSSKMVIRDRVLYFPRFSKFYSGSFDTSLYELNLMENLDDVDVVKSWDSNVVDCVKLNNAGCFCCWKVERFVKSRDLDSALYIFCPHLGVSKSLRRYEEYQSFFPFLEIKHALIAGKHQDVVAVLSERKRVNLMYLSDEFMKK